MIQVYINICIEDVFVIVNNNWGRFVFVKYLYVEVKFDFYLDCVIFKNVFLIEF